MEVIRDSKNNVLYKLQENKLYNKTIVRDAHGKKITEIKHKDKK